MVLSEEAIAALINRNRPSKTLKFSRSLRSRRESEDYVELDVSLGSRRLLQQLLPVVVSPDHGSTVASLKKLGHLNALARWCAEFNPEEEEETGMAFEDLMACVRTTLIHESKEIRAAGCRVIRHLVKSKKTIQAFLNLKIPFLLGRCLDMTTENSSEQVQVLRLFHYLFCLAPKDFPPTLVRSLASIAQFGCGNSEIKAHHVALAILGEIAIFNASLAQRTGVFPLLLHNAVDLQDQRGAEALLSIILHARNMPSLRNMVGNLHLSSVLAPLTDTTYKHYYIDSERQEERSRRLLCSRSAVLSCLRSWPGLFELAFMEDHREPPFRNVIRVLGSEKDENVDVVLDLLFSLFDLPRPPDPPPPSTFKSRRTSAFDKAPRSPSVSSAPPPPQDHPFEEVLSKVTNRTAYDSTWRLHDGFTVAEGLRVLPPLRRDRPDLVLSYLALLLCYLISENVFHLLTEVILNRSQRLGVKATLLLGELLHLAAMLPSPTPSRDALPLLVSTAGATGTSERSVKAKEAVKHLLLVEDVITRCFDVSLLKPNSFYLRQLLWFHHHGHGTPEEARKEEEPKPSPRKSRGSWSSSGSSKRRRRNTNDFKSLLKRPFEEREGPTASSPPSAIPKGLQFQLNAPVDSWDWNIVRNVIRDPSAILCEEAVVPGSPSAQFVKTLVHFYAPSSELYSVMQQSSPHAEAATELGVLLFDFLLKIAETDEAPYLDALLEDIHGAIVIMVSDAPSPSCLLAPGKLSSTLAHHYFLFVGRLTQSRKGMDILERNRIIQVLRDLLATTAHDTYFKLIISSVNYSFPGITRTLLSGALTSDKEASRIFATEFLCVLARVGVPDFPSWGLELCVFQLYDPSDVVVKAAVGVLEELCEQEAYVDALVSLRPSLLHLGDAGVNLLTRCCGVPSGFQFLRDSGFLSHHLMDWRDKYHLRYVQIVHDGIANVLTRHQRDETGRYGRRTNVPPRLVPYSAPWHLHSELSRHPEGLAFLLEREGDWMTQMWSILLSPNVGSDENNLVKIKAAIWSLAHFASTPLGIAHLLDPESLLVKKGSPQPENGGDPQGTEGEVGARQNFGRDLLSAVFEIVRSADISSLRGTAFYAISLISVTVTGAELARQKGWVATASRLHLATLNLSDASFSLSPSSPVTPENVHRLKGPAADQSEHPSSEEDHAQSRSSTLPLPSVNPAIVTPPSLKAPSLDQSPSPSSQPSTSTGRLSSAIRSFVRGVSSAHSSPATTKRSTGAFSFISGGPTRERGSSAGFWPSAHPRKTNSATWSTDSESSDVLTATDLAWSPPEGMEVDPKGSIGPLSSLDEELDLFGEMGWEEWSSSDPNLVGPLPPQRRSGLSGSSVDGGPPLKTTKKKLLRQLWRMRRPPSSEDEEAVEEAAEELEELDTSSDGIFLPCYHHDSNDNVTTCAERSQKKIRVKKEPLLPFSSQLEGDESCDEEEIVKDPTNAAISRIFPSDRVIGICLPKDLSVLVRRTREEVPEVEPYPPPSLAPLLEALNVAKPASISGVTEVIADDSDAIPTGADPTSLMTTVTTAPTGTTQTKTTAEAKGKLVADLGLEFHCREHCLSDDHSAFEDPMKSLVAGRSLSPSAKLPSTPSISPSPSISSAVSSACVGAEAEEEKPTQRSQLTTQTSHSSRSRRGTTPAADGMHEEDATGRCRIRTEILRLIANMSCSIACKLIEQRLLGLKRKFPTTLGELCLYSDVCVLLSKVHLRLNSRKFVQELLQDVRFSCLLEKPREMFGVNVLPEEPTSPTSQGHSKAGILEGAVGGTETDVPGNADSSPEHEFSQSDVGKTLGMMFGKTKAPASRDQHPVHLTQEGVPSISVSPAKKQIPDDDKEIVPIVTPNGTTR